MVLAFLIVVVVTVSAVWGWDVGKWVALGSVGGTALYFVWKVVSFSFKSVKSEHDHPDHISNHKLATDVLVYEGSADHPNVWWRKAPLPGAEDPNEGLYLVEFRDRLLEKIPTWIGTIDRAKEDARDLAEDYFND